MRIFFLVFSCFLLSAGVTQAACVGANLIDELSAEDFATIREAADKDEFGSGNMWIAKKGDHVINLIGTLHMYDDRIPVVANAIEPYIRQSEIVYLELNRSDMQAIAQAPAEDPGAFFIRSGPTLPALLGKEEWELLSSKLSERGIPGFIAAQFKPWYVNLVLMSPPCLNADQVAGLKGLDMQILEIAESEGLQVRSLDTVGNVLSLFQEGTEQEHLEGITMALDTIDAADALAATTVEAYFAEEGRLLWEFNRLYLDRNDKIADEKKQSILAELEEKLLVRRNLDWIDKITEASEQNATVTVAVGALHLSGEVGLPRLLVERGYDVERAGAGFWPQ